ncbi:MULTISPECIES: putative cytokinetic ring protein SteA [unclassified Corynebacterium]|uniref:putative cytokinetic ring protein SteA n=1 Tax=Corynebacterium TaxID=1716 RepID=UPI0025507E2C|nr:MULTISPECIES: putative cytokinetic ring protein SteA [unclassified Corynebacterium]MDK8475471.1 putative cytokinetic ring protein SteA [Corynebacterium sp. MSK310]MDK8491844.1 putative cytokinetic ring protein SteA [Corynebacterium sp. MSK175]MDK8673024.1 putative cytokinetic ring protein SteA [Corynebacterium sp. MSK189]MDK8735404.1 putative cytokinetic ring protein SteA [Corynebacterium sp. MSK306]
MEPMALFSRTPDHPGEHAALRDCTPGAKGLKKFSAGDIAVIDAANISRPEAQTLVELQPSAVVNVARFSTGSIPNCGPHMLLDADIDLLEGLGEEFISEFKDGKKAHIGDDGKVYVADKVIGTGQKVSRERADKNFKAAQSALIDHMESYFASSIDFINSEGPLLIDGLGVPASGAEIAGRKVIVLSPTEDHRSQLKELRNFIREYEPLLIAVDEAADSLLEQGYKPDFIIGDPAKVCDESLRCGARIVVPADPEGSVESIDRIQELGIGAMTFPAASEAATDLALLFADYHGAGLIVQAGGGFDLDDVFANRVAPSAVLSRLKAGTKVVDAEAVINLYSAPSSHLGWLWALLSILVAIAAIILIVGFGGSQDFLSNLSQTWSSLF